MTAKTQIDIRRVLLCGAALIAPAAAANAQAQADPQAAEGNEIVVTANRREESLQDVPSAVTAISEKEIQARGMDSFEGFARSVPGLTMNQGVKNRASFNIRGVATSLTGGNTQDPVAVYINDTPVSDTFGAIVQPDLRLFDVERIEVLRGPQGTLFGSGSLGGTVRIITNKPDATKFEAAGRVDLGVTKGGAFRQRYDAMVNVPLAADTLALRVVGYYRDEEGWVRNVRLGTRNDTVDWGGRVALRWTPSDALTVKAEVIHQDSDPEDADAWNPALGKFKRSSAIPEPRRNNLTNYNLAIDYSFDDFATLTASSTYQQNKSAMLLDNGALLGPGTPNFVSNSDPWNSRFYVQELRLVSNTASRLEWVVGAFYIDRKTIVPDYLITAPGLNDYLKATYGVAPGSDSYFDTDITTASTELAGYADASYEIVDGLKLRGGMRVFRTTASYVEKDRVTLNLATFKYAAPLSFSNRASSTNTTWRTGLSYESDRDLMVYANVSKGFRIGQVNANRGTSAIDPADYVIPEGYEPDSTINYELGAKTSWLGGLLTLNLAGFYIDWTNIQIDGLRISDRRSFIANAGKASVKGVEFEMAARPVRGLNLYGTVTVQDGRIDSVPTNIIVPAARGDRLPGLARWKLSGGIEYRWDVGASSQAYARIDGQFTDATPNAFANAGRNALYAVNDEFSTLDGSIGLDAGWGTVALYAENLTNEDAVILKNLSSPNPFVTLRPRTLGIRLTMRR
ncbi:TonB-dependent receptor [Sphingomonas colocasiae]|uniref:TonB-dependent receptor n=1 Tax=Sphingomonas colocasiae TaxID=1848973 RepID=A0ABS7Q1E2_9SPHN|nr:TonB-dependent receptor [Sphingomonas colocasiae]MBY8826352.1 TonB-dependent receptor [Sphingomonas colocasiae]